MDNGRTQPTADTTAAAGGQPSELQANQPRPPPAAEIVDAVPAKPAGAAFVSAEPEAVKKKETMDAPEKGDESVHVRPTDLSGRTDMKVVEEANSAAMHGLRPEIAHVVEKICDHIKRMTLEMIDNGKLYRISFKDLPAADCPGVEFGSDLLDKEADMRVFETDIPVMRAIVLAAARIHFDERGIQVDMKIKDGVHIPYLMSPHGHVNVMICNSNWRERYEYVRFYHKREPFDKSASDYHKVIERLYNGKIVDLDKEKAAKKTTKK